ncbi:hypothetical protein RF11_10544 [Thelohanellus kitauei]|uniref:Uncharacterized protein n=1 Tax=Thelohanellus kitauei TaxID=669202 RepID=A0A0C2MZK0_THEKT|nr:hypothetical protein RF11_10544 [Thelohanellus kitauei]
MNFEDIFTRRLCKKIRLTTLFSISLWNQIDRFISHLTRTNKNIEWWHIAILSMVSANHQNIFVLLNAIKFENSLTDHKIDIALINRDVQCQTGGMYDNITYIVTSLIDNSKSLSYVESHRCIS